MSKKKNKSRIKQANKHAIKRAKERYDLYLSENDLQRISALIRYNCAMLVRNESHTRSHFIVRYKGEYLYAVYGNLIKTIHTFLPSEKIDDNLLAKIDKFPYF